jgi:hypothetical protein
MRRSIHVVVVVGEVGEAGEGEDEDVAKKASEVH